MAYGIEFRFAVFCGELIKEHARRATGTFRARPEDTIFCFDALVSDTRVICHATCRSAAQFLEDGPWLIGEILAESQALCNGSDDFGIAFHAFGGLFGRAAQNDASFEVGLGAG